MAEIKLPETVKTIDCNYLFPGFAAAYLIIEGDRAAFIDNNTVHAAPRLLAALRENNLKPEQVDYIIVTHVHLDHAGGTSVLVKECPNAIVLAHQRAARHIIDPTRLIKGATAVYGESEFKRLYGSIQAVDEKLVRIVEDGEILDFGKRSFTFIYTLGHAKHHMCVYDSGTNGIFTGDSLGLAYPILQTGSELFVFPSSTPTDFDPEKYDEGIDAILATGADLAFLTHFGPLRQIKRAAGMMKDYLNRMRDTIKEARNQGLEGDVLQGFCRRVITEFLRSELEKRGLSYTAEIENFLKMDVMINSMGIAHAVEKSRNQ
jgi:glyoxylase-like metal-dependent hydrolase (beta-lactamase superfamily II)